MDRYLWLDNGYTPKVEVRLYYTSSSRYMKKIRSFGIRSKMTRSTRTAVPNFSCSRFPAPTRVILTSSLTRPACSCCKWVKQEKTGQPLRILRRSFKSKQRLTGLMNIAGIRTGSWHLLFLSSGCRAGFPASGPNPAESFEAISINAETKRRSPITVAGTGSIPPRLIII